MTNNQRQHRRNGQRPQPRGMALIIVVVTASICLLLFGIWARTLVQEHQRFASQQFRLQAARLAEAGLRRAQALKAADPEFQGETWAIAADALGGKNTASVQIRVTRTDAASTRYEAVAQYPAGAVRRAQITKTIEIPTPSTGNES